MPEPADESPPVADRVPAGLPVGDTAALRTALLGSSAANTALANWGHQTMAWAEDDLKIVAEMARRAGIALPQARVNREICRALKPRRYRLSEYGR